MRKRVVIVNGSLRKKSTYSILEKIENLLHNCDVEFLNLKDYDLKPCVGCERCLRIGNCNIKDEASIVLDKIQNADGIIIGTPVYLRQISGLLKMVIDRGCSWYHRSPLVGKPILFACSTQVTGLKQTQKYLKDLSVQWGTIYSGTIARTMFKIDDEVKESEIAKFNHYLTAANRKKYRPSWKQVFEFYTQKVLAVNILPLDLQFWSEKGYINQPYYYDCRINIFKRTLGYAYYKMLSYFIVKNKVE